MAFAFWCRESNLKNLKKKYCVDGSRKGRGLTFHIAPSNVPINFAFSFAFSLLSGNNNIVRLPSTDFPQIKIFLKHFEEVSSRRKFKSIREGNCFIRYEKNSEHTADFSLISDVRMIWGGDSTISTVKQLPTKANCLDVCFADKYSVAIIDSQSIIDLDSNAIKSLALRFYNDSYIFDQNACSSPRSVFWIGTDEICDQAKKIFWIEIEKISRERYSLEAITSTRKFTDFCEIVTSSYISPNIVKKFDNHLTIIELIKFHSNFIDLPTRFGIFLEFKVNSLEDFFEVTCDKFQTVTYFGFESEVLLSALSIFPFSGIDRFVPFGSGLDIDIVWDGYDLPITLSRKISVK